MRHLVIAEHGRFLGLCSERLEVRSGQGVIAELPLSRLSTITVARNGVGLSSDAVLACAARGIRLFFTDFRGAQVAAVMGSEQHATVAVRKRQLAFLDTAPARELARRFVLGKLANQRALLRYFAKYHERTLDGPLAAAAKRIESGMRATASLDLDVPGWRSRLLGHEGSGASIYFTALREAALLPASFESRLGRGARDPANAALNLGYSILLTRTWTTLSNAGLECFAGVLHEDRPGKPSLVLDVMEEHRPFIVDRVVVTLRQALGEAIELDAGLRRRIIDGVTEAMQRRLLHRGRKLRIETVMQRQAYRLAGHFASEQTYRPLRYAW